MPLQRQTFHSVHNKKFWTEFFYLYESLPALWDTNSPLYKNRQAKIEGYDIMVDKLKEIEVTADREDVLRKINIFRTNFRREWSRVNVSLTEGRDYQTTLWYYDLLSFLKTTDTRRDRKRKIDDDGEKSIMRKRRTNPKKQKSTGQIIVASKKDNLIEYQLNSTHDIEYNIEEDTNFDYVDDQLNNELVYDKNDNSTATQKNHLSGNHYHDDEVDDEDDQSQQNYSHQEEFENYALESNNKTNNKKIRLTSDNVSQMDEEIIPTGDPIEINNTAEDRKLFQDYSSENENESIQTAQWSLKVGNTQSISTLQLAAAANSNTNRRISDNPSSKFVRNVKTMTSNGSSRICSSNLSESSEILAKSWAVQYDELSQNQKVLARKAINDILFEGCMGNLSIGSNGGVTFNAANYINNGNMKTVSTADVDNGEIYEQSTIITPRNSSTSTSAKGSGRAITIIPTANLTPNQHNTAAWLKL